MTISDLEREPSRSQSAISPQGIRRRTGPSRGSTRSALLHIYRCGSVPHFVQELVQLVRSNRFGQISIHADAEVSLAVAFHDVAVRA